MRCKKSGGKKNGNEEDDEKKIADKRWKGGVATPPFFCPQGQFLQPAVESPLPSAAAGSQKKCAKRYAGVITTKPLGSQY
jgi:hypothetical protein